jgi:hypothetical protein
MEPLSLSITPIVVWWQSAHSPHAHLGCVCTTGGWCGSVESLARRVGVSHSTMFRRLRTGTLDVMEADCWAVAVGVHPIAIWPRWDRPRTYAGSLDE